MASSSLPSVQKQPLAPVPSIYDENLFSPAKKVETTDFSFQNEKCKIINQSNLHQNDLYSQETFSDKNNFDGN